MLRFIRKSCAWIVLVPVLCVVLGTLSNTVVIKANHGKFPVLQNEVQVLEDFEKGAIKLQNGTIMLDPVHCVMNENTKLNALADIFERPSGISSVGDELQKAGMEAFDYSLAIWIAVLCMKLRKEDSEECQHNPYQSRFNR